jgi:hypothetical protein
MWPGGNRGHADRGDPEPCKRSCQTAALGGTREPDDCERRHRQEVANAVVALRAEARKHEEGQRQRGDEELRPARQALADLPDPTEQDQAEPERHLHGDHDQVVIPPSVHAALAEQVARAAVCLMPQLREEADAVPRPGPFRHLTRPATGRAAKLGPNRRMVADMLANRREGETRDREVSQQHNPNEQHAPLE